MTRLVRSQSPSVTAKLTESAIKKIIGQHETQEFSAVKTKNFAKINCHSEQNCTKVPINFPADGSLTSVIFVFPENVSTEKVIDNFAKNIRLNESGGKPIFRNYFIDTKGALLHIFAKQDGKIEYIYCE